MTDVKERTTEETERKRMETLWWAGVLIWIGLALGAQFLDILPDLGNRDGFWPWIFIGVGPWSLALNTYQRTSPTLPNPSTWDWIWTVIFMLLGVGAVVDIGGEIFGAVALVTIGVVILVRTLRRPTDTG